MHREDGVAMFVALTVTFVVLLLSVVVIGQSIRSLGTSAYDRRRLFSIHAAEAGLNDWYRYLQVTPIASLECGRPDGALDTSGADASFTTTAVYFDADQEELDVCGGADTTPFSETVLPAYVLITSEGRAAGQVPRTMETFMRITPRRGGFDAAILASSGASFSNNSTIGAAAGGGNGDVYVTSGNLTVSQQLTVSGSLYVPNGSASVSGSTVVNGDLWARDSVVLNNPATVRGDVLSSLGNVSGTGTVIGDVVAAGTVATGTLSIGGVATSNATVDDVPTQSLPQIGWNQPYWETAGYTVYNAVSGPGLTQCEDAYDFVKTRWASGNVVVRITDTCKLSTFEPGSGNVSMSLKGNLAVVSEGGFDFSRQSTWSEAPTHTGGVDLLFISTWTTTSPCPVSKDITVGQNTNFVSPNVSVLFYTPCKVTMSNQTGVFSGQVMGGTVNIGQNFSMLYEPVYVPGYGTITGFDQDIAYIREI
jgi:hypothetical protein